MHTFFCSIINIIIAKILCGTCILTSKLYFFLSFFQYSRLDLFGRPPPSDNSKLEFRLPPIPNSFFEEVTCDKAVNCNCMALAFNFSELIKSLRPIILALCNLNITLEAVVEVELVDEQDGDNIGVVGGGDEVDEVDRPESR